MLLRERDFAPVGLDISPKLIALAREKFAGIEFMEGDAENLPFADASLDAVLLSGLIHHFPDPRRLAQETHRVLKPGGRFVAFDPNRMNPFMWLYRDTASPFYSSVGVTENERPILARQAFACGATIWAGLPIVTSHRSARARCCRSTISSTTPSSIVRL